MSKKDCTNCRHRLTGFDGGFGGIPVTCECSHFGVTENREDCKRFKRPFPNGFALLLAFQEWYNEEVGYIDIDDLLRFRKEWK